MEWLWLILLAMVVFLMYMWFQPFPTVQRASGCSACAAKKNVPSVE
jgi:hypothetical protein